MSTDSFSSHPKSLESSESAPEIKQVPKFHSRRRLELYEKSTEVEEKHLIIEIENHINEMMTNYNFLGNLLSAARKTLRFNLYGKCSDEIMEEIRVKLEPYCNSIQELLYTHLQGSFQNEKLYNWQEKHEQVFRITKTAIDELYRVIKSAKLPEEKNKKFINLLDSYVEKMTRELERKLAFCDINSGK